MGILQISLILSAFLCALVSGFLFAYAVVIMPGIKILPDKDFIRAFQVTDLVIQNNQPLFILVWLGSALALLLSAVLGIGQLDGLDQVLLAIATLIYLVGVQLSTIIIHLPLNNTLQTMHIDSMSDAELSAARSGFEGKWNKSNQVRTALSCLVTMLLLILIVRL